MATKTLRIPLLIDANGKWAAYGYATQDEADPDWPMIDEVADSDNPLVCPQRKWITVTVTLPEVEELEGHEEP